MFAKDGWPIVRCPACGLVYVDAELDRAALDAIYGRDYYEGAVFENYLGDQDVRIASGRDRVRRIGAIVPSGRLLDVGCAAGFFLLAASERYEVAGVELSAFAAQYAREEFGLQVFTGELADTRFDDGAFDVVTLWDVIEHVLEPRAVIAEAARVTRPDGLLVLTTGNIEGRLARRNLERWNLMTPPAHLTFFSPSTLERLLNGSGFEIIRRVADGVFSSRRRLANPLMHSVAGTLGIGNVMTVFARRTNEPRPRPLGARVPSQLTRAIAPRSAVVGRE
jgi:2-polyprenyl-3-methyl-5-hydroxy-6-metoxy-1,4-benzoquinol methylase